MNPIIRVASVVLFAASAGIYSGASLAAAAAPAAAEFYPIVGHWRGHGQLVEPGQPPVKLAISLYCQKVSAGWAVRCAMQAKNKQMTMTESDLMGVDPVTGQAHWYAVTNQGETHDHLVKWQDAHTMLAHYDWTQQGKHMHEAIAFKLKGKRLLSFDSIVTADGKQAGEFVGTVKRR
jgi:hypothetical protein